MILRALILTCLLATMPAAMAQEIDPGKSEIRFVSRQMNVPIEGRFAGLSGTVHLDPAKPENGRAEIEVALAGIDAGSDDATTEVRRRSWFNIAAFPVASFIASGVEPLCGNQYQAQGELSIKGITRRISVPFSVRQDGGTTIYEGGFTLLRLNFNIGEGVWSDTETVANEVEVRFRIVQNAGG
jgi:polyisoprenoid-binding protein YceI